MFSTIQTEEYALRKTRKTAPALDIRHRESPKEATTSCLVRLGVAMHEVGFASHEIESNVRDAAAALGTTAEVFATPTALFMGLGPQGAQRTLLHRLEPADDDISGMADLLDISTGICSGKLTPQQADLRLEEFRHARTKPPSRRAHAIWIVAFALSSAGAAALFGGGIAEVCVASALSTLVACIARLTPIGTAPVLSECVIAMTCSFGASLAGSFGWISAPDIVTLSSIIIFLPGLSMTRALADLARRDLAAGTARLMGALTGFLSLGLGVALGHALTRGTVDLLGLPDAVATAPATHWSLKVLASLVTPPALAVLLNARRREVLAIGVGTLIASLGTQFGAALVGPNLGVGLGALALGVFANQWASRRSRPTATILVPGLILLVPGTMGLRSLELLMSAQTVDGITIAFETIWVSAALVAGLVVANAVNPPSRVTRRAPLFVDDSRDAAGHAARRPAPLTPHGAAS